MDRRIGFEEPADMSLGVSHGEDCLPVLEETALPGMKLKKNGSNGFATSALSVLLVTFMCICRQKFGCLSMALKLFCSDSWVPGTIVPHQEVWP